MKADGDEVVVFIEASNHWILCCLSTSCTKYPGIFQEKTRKNRLQFYVQELKSETVAE